MAMMMTMVVMTMMRMTMMTVMTMMMMIGNLQGLVTPSCLLLVRQKLLDLDTNEAVTIMVLTGVVF